MSTPVWLTATPPTPNGELHIGHLAGPYVAVDVLRRYLCAEGTPVLMTTGIDDHQSYVAVRGTLDQRTAERVADDYGERIITAWRDARVDFDRIIEPRTVPGYVNFIQTFFQKLYDNGAIRPRTRPLPYCTGCDRWLYEAYLTGRCPHCDERCNGNVCERCGRPNDCGDLREPHCVQCGQRARLRDQTRLFFPLAPYTEQLSRFWAQVSMPPHLRALCEQMLHNCLPEVAVSHPAAWGIPVPVLGFEDQRIYVWFEMAPGYLLQYDPRAARPVSRPVQFFGFDNGYFHAVLFPALFLAWDRELPLPSTFVVNEFYRLAGEKFSTSRRHAVWALQCLAESGSDALRFHVLRDRPQGRETNFEAGDLRRAHEHLDNEWNGWLRGLFEQVRAETGGPVPAQAPSGPDWRLLCGRLTRLVDELRETYSVTGFDPRRAVDLLDEMVRCGRDFGFVHRHDRDRPAGTTAYHSALVGQLAVAAALAAWAAPVLPEGAAKLSTLLGLPSQRRVDAAALAPPRQGALVTVPAGPVFGSR
jgi:methionyl-tRNA synthetase